MAIAQPTRLGVRIQDGSTDRVVTRYASDLSFRKVALGGHHSADFTLNMSRRDLPTLGPADRVVIYNCRNAAKNWEGYANNPGREEDGDGQSFKVSASGGMARAAQERRALQYIDSLVDQFTRDNITVIPASATTDAGPDPAGILTTDGIVLQFANGNIVGTGQAAQMGYSFSATDMTFGALYAEFKSGKIDSGYDTQLAWSGGGGVGATTLNASISTAMTGVNRWVGESGQPPANTTRIALNIKRVAGSTNVGDDLTWTFYTNIHLLGRRMTASGALLTGMAGMTSNQYVRADWVVYDLIGRMMPYVDAANATVEATSAQIDQLSYREATTVATVLDDLALHEPDMLWEILETGLNGLHRFNYRAWPSAPRYEVSTADGYSAPGSDNDLCNRVAVNWTDSLGRPQVTVVNSYVADLATAFPPITRDADPITLPPGLGSLANAQRIGTQVLASLAGAEKAATVTVQRPIMDRLRCRLVWPHEIEPGYSVTVRETGETLRMTEMNYADNEQVATLSLGTPQLTNDQRIARLTKPKR